MRILYISAFPPNRKTAGQNYSRLLINDLIGEHDLSLFYFTYPGHSLDITERVRDVTPFKLSIINKIANIFLLSIIFPLFSGRFNIACLYKLRKIAKSYDLVYFDFSQVFIYSLFIKHPNKVFMAHDVIYQMYERKKLFCKKLILPFIRYSESFLLHSCKTTLCFSNKDKALISQLYSINASVVSFYLDPLLATIKLEEIKIDNYFVLYGAWGRKENYQGLEWFLNYVYVKIQNKLKLVIIGGGMNDKMQNKLSQYSNINYLGYVDNPYLLISKAQALIAPLFSGAGVKVKVIESLALGTPVIGTGIAFEGIEQFEVNHLSPMMLVESYNEFINAMTNYDISITKKISIQKSFLEKNFNNKYINILSYK